VILLSRTPDRLRCLTQGQWTCYRTGKGESPDCSTERLLPESSVSVKLCKHAPTPLTMSGMSVQSATTRSAVSCICLRKARLTVKSVCLASDDIVSNMLGTMCSMSVSVSGAKADSSSRLSVCLPVDLTMAAADSSSSFSAPVKVQRSS